MPIDNTAFSITGYTGHDSGNQVTKSHGQRNLRPRNNPDENNQNSATVSNPSSANSKAAEASKASAVVFGSNDLREAFRKIKQSLLRQSNEVISLTNEKSTLVESADSVTQKQLESANRIKSLFSENGSSAELAAEQQRFEQLQEVSQEVEEEIASHNIESGTEQAPSISLGTKNLASFSLKPLDYRAVQGDVSEPQMVAQTIGDLQTVRQQLQQQQSELHNIREQVRSVTKQSLEEIHDFSNASIKSLDEATYAAQNIADLIAGGGSADIVFAHGQMPSHESVAALLEDEQ